MAFAVLAARLSAVCFEQLGDEAMWVTGSNDPVITRAALDRETVVVGDLGQAIDTRPSVRLPKAVVGNAKTGRVTVEGRIWTLDSLISDDGYVVRFFVK